MKLIIGIKGYKGKVIDPSLDGNEVSFLPGSYANEDAIKYATLPRWLTRLIISREREAYQEGYFDKQQEFKKALGG